MSEPEKAILGDGPKQLASYDASVKDAERASSSFVATKSDRSETREYYLSKNYIGSLVAIGLAGMAGIGSFSLVAPVLSSINNDIGPDPNIVWVSLASNLTQAVMLTLCGRLSDIFGRRYFQISGTVLALLGCIIGATANSVNMLIGANAITGIAAATQVSFPYLIAELVPIKHRYLASSYIYTLLIPVSAVAPMVATTLVENTSLGWRSSYIIMIAINAAALVCWVLFYFPPSWKELAVKSGEQVQSKRQMLRQMDYGGFFLLSAGLLLFLMGLSWGGSVYEWRSAAVISTVVIGGVLLGGFVVYEIYCPSSRVLVPMRLFANTGWLAVVMTLAMAASMYYAFNIVFPTQVNVLYASETAENQGWLKCVIGAPPLAGQIIASLLATKIGKIKQQLIVSAVLGAAFYGATACVTSSNQGTVVALLCAGGFALGWVDAVCLASLSVTLDDQSMIGTAVGIASSLRTIISTSAATVFTTILNNRLAQTVPALVPPAIIAAGLPTTSVPEFLVALSTNPVKLSHISGANSTIVEVGMSAFKAANAQAYSTVYLSTIAFSGLGVIFSFLTPRIEARLTNEISCKLKT